MSNNGTVHAVSAVIAGIGLQPPPPSVPAPPLLQTATQIGPLQSATQVASRPMQTQTLHPQAMVHSATAVPPPPMSTASAVVAQSSHYVMQQALSLQPDDMIKVYENLRKHLHNEGLLRGMSVSARTKRRVDCLKDGCPGYALTASKKQATCKDGKGCGYHAQWGCSVCPQGKQDFKRCIC